MYVCMWICVHLSLYIYIYTQVVLIVIIMTIHIILVSWQPCSAQPSCAEPSPALLSPVRPFLAVRLSCNNNNKHNNDINTNDNDNTHNNTNNDDNDDDDNNIHTTFCRKVYLNCFLAIRRTYDDQLVGRSIGSLLSKASRFICSLAPASKVELEHGLEGNRSWRAPQRVRSWDWEGTWERCNYVFTLHYITLQYINIEYKLCYVIL